MQLGEAKDFSKLHTHHYFTFSAEKILGERETDLVTGWLGLFCSKKHLKKGYKPMKEALFIKHISFDQVSSYKLLK
jgi:hypothetical protein